jgi:hypothetical protein
MMFEGTAADRDLLERNDTVMLRGAQHGERVSPAPASPRRCSERASRGNGCRWTTPSGARLTCRHRSCTRVLKKDAGLPVCSEACADELRHCEVTLAALDGMIGPVDLPPDLHCLLPKPWRSRSRYEGSLAQESFRTNGTRCDDVN